MNSGRESKEIAARLDTYFGTHDRPGVVSVYLFGSYARESAHRESDIDVGVLLAREAHPAASQRFAERVALSSLLIDVLDHNEVDVVILNDVPPHFARHVVTEGRRVFCAAPVRDRDFVRDAQLRAADLEPFLRRTRRIKLDALRT